MAQKFDEGENVSDERNGLLTNRLIESGEDDRKHTVAVTGGDLHYMTEVAIADIDDHGSTRQILHSSLSRHTALLASVFETARVEYERRVEADMRGSEAHRIRLTDAEVCAILAAIRDRREEWDDLVGDGMDQLGAHLSDQTGYKRPT